MREARIILYALVTEICASVPFHLDISAANSVILPQEMSTGATPTYLAGELGGYLLLQPLMVAYSISGIATTQKRWILNKALEISKLIGIKEEVLETKLSSFDFG